MTTAEIEKEIASLTKVVNNVSHKLGGRFLFKIVALNRELQKRKSNG